jgi:hypothetical protein
MRLVEGAQGHCGIGDPNRMRLLSGSVCTASRCPRRVVVGVAGARHAGGAPLAFAGLVERGLVATAEPVGPGAVAQEQLGDVLVGAAAGGAERGRDQLGVRRGLGGQPGPDQIDEAEGGGLLVGDGAALDHAPPGPQLAEDGGVGDRSEAVDDAPGGC